MSSQHRWTEAVVFFLFGVSLARAQLAQVDTGRSARARRLMIGPEARRLGADTARFTGARRLTVPPAERQPQREIRVHLDVDPKLAQIGEPVKFGLSSTDVDVNSGYGFAFDFGDGSREVKPVGQPDILHVYWAARTYTVSALAQIPLGLMALTHAPAKIVVDSVTVRVDSVSLEANPETVEVGSPVELRVNLRHPNPSFQFRFFFGDGEISSWQAEQSSPHAYSAAGTFLTFAEIGLRQHSLTRTSVRRIVVVPGAIPSPDAGVVDAYPPRSEASDSLATAADMEKGRNLQWWWYFLAALCGIVVMVAIYQLQKWFRAPRMQIALHQDVSGARTKAAGPVTIDVEIRLRSMLSEGKFSIVAGGDSIIRKERREHG